MVRLSWCGVLAGDGVVDAASIGGVVVGSDGGPVTVEEEEGLRMGAGGGLFVIA